MPDTKAIPEPTASDAFVRQAGLRRPALFTELWQFVRENKKWWLTPILVALLVFGALLALGGTAAAPFIYTLF